MPVTYSYSNEMPASAETEMIRLENSLKEAGFCVGWIAVWSGITAQLVQALGDEAAIEKTVALASIMKTFKNGTVTRNG